MINVVIRHTVDDFDAWKAGYDQHEGERREHGCTAAIVNRVAGSPGDILATLSFGDEKGAHAFLDDPALKEAMRDAGVQGTPEIVITEQVESVDYTGASV
jgi:hypothetical protein